MEDFSIAERYGTPCEKLVAKAHRLVTQKQPVTEIKEVYKQATEKYSKEAVGWHFYGASRHSWGENDDETVSALQNAIDLKFRQVYMTHYFLGVVQNERGQYDEAIRQHEAAIAGNGQTFTIAHIALGGLLLSKGSSERAKQCFLTATRLNSTQIRANVGLVHIYLQEGNVQEAVLHAATFIEAAYARGRGDQGGGSKRGGSGGGGGGGGGGGSGGGGEGGGSDDDTEKQKEKWDKVKGQATHKATVGNDKSRQYYLTKIRGENKWVSYDHARHAGAAFKVWRDKSSCIEFESSYDVNLNEMSGKHESQEGKVIKKADMNITQIVRKK